MRQITKRWWGGFVDSFHASETIIWCRCQMLIGAAYVALQGIDMTAFITDHKFLQYYIFGNALITEVLRRRRADYFGAPK